MEEQGAAPDFGGDIAAAVAERFRLGPPQGPMAPVSQGIQGRLFSLRTESGRWAVKLLFREPNRSVIEAGTRLQEAAEGSGVRSARPVRSDQGDIVERIGDEWVRVSAWLDLGPAVALPAERPVLAAVGVTLARLHRLRLAAPSPVSRWLTNPPPAERWSGLLTEARANSAPLAGPLADALPGFTQLTRIALEGAPSAPILCHCDLTPENVAGVDGGLVLLDWERAGAEAPEQELGYVLSHWCWSPEAGADIEGAAALTESYRAEGGTFEPGPGLFRAAISAWLNFGFGVAASALRSPDPDRRGAPDLATSMLARPLSPGVIEQLLLGIGGGAHA